MKIGDFKGDPPAIFLNSMYDRLTPNFRLPSTCGEAGCSRYDRPAFDISQFRRSAGQIPSTFAQPDALSINKPARLIKNLICRATPTVEVEMPRTRARLNKYPVYCRTGIGAGSNPCRLYHLDGMGFAMRNRVTPPSLVQCSCTSDC